MQPSPHTGLSPVPQPPPAAHARAALHLDRQPLPRDARAQNEQDASQSSSVLQGRTTALWTRLRGRKKQGDLLPEIVREDRFGHPLQRAITRFVRRSKLRSEGAASRPRLISRICSQQSTRPGCSRKPMSRSCSAPDRSTVAPSVSVRCRLRRSSRQPAKVKTCALSAALAVGAIAVRRSTARMRARSYGRPNGLAT